MINRNVCIVKNLGKVVSSQPQQQKNAPVPIQLPLVKKPEDNEPPQEPYSQKQGSTMEISYLVTPTKSEAQDQKLKDSVIDLSKQIKNTVYNLLDQEIKLSHDEIEKIISEGSVFKLNNDEAQPPEDCTKIIHTIHIDEICIARKQLHDARHNILRPLFMAEHHAVISNSQLITLQIYNNEQCVNPMRVETIWGVLKTTWEQRLGKLFPQAPIKKLSDPGEPFIINLKYWDHTNAAKFFERIELLINRKGMYRQCGLEEYYVEVGQYDPLQVDEEIMNSDYKVEFKQLFKIILDQQQQHNNHAPQRPKRDELGRPVVEEDDDEELFQHHVHKPVVKQKHLFHNQTYDIKRSPEHIEGLIADDMFRQQEERDLIEKQKAIAKDQEQKIWFEQFCGQVWEHTLHIFSCLSNDTPEEVLRTLVELSIAIQNLDYTDVYNDDYFIGDFYLYGTDLIHLSAYFNFLKNTEDKDFTIEFVNMRQYDFSFEPRDKYLCVENFMEDYQNYYEALMKCFKVVNANSIYVERTEERMSRNKFYKKDQEKPKPYEKNVNDQTDGKMYLELKEWEKSEDLDDQPELTLFRPMLENTKTIHQQLEVQRKQVEKAMIEKKESMKCIAQHKKKVEYENDEREIQELLNMPDEKAPVKVIIKKKVKVSVQRKQNDDRKYRE